MHFHSSFGGQSGACTHRKCISPFEIGGRLHLRAGIGCGGKATSVGALSSRRNCTHRICIPTCEMGGRLFLRAGIGWEGKATSGGPLSSKRRFSSRVLCAFSAIRGQEEKPHAGKARIFCEHSTYSGAEKPRANYRSLRRRTASEAVKIDARRSNVGIERDVSDRRHGPRVQVRWQ
jgi:hypothetical protein